MPKPLLIAPWLLAVGILAGCTSASRLHSPDSSGAADEGLQTIAAAREAGAGKYAVVELTRAERKLALAAQTRDYRRQRQLLEQSRLDAELALAKTRAFEAERATSEAWRADTVPTGLRAPAAEQRPTH